MIEPMGIPETTANVRADILAIVQKADADGLDHKEIFNGLAMVFGELLSAFEPEAVAEWLRGQARKIEAMGRTPGSSARQ